MKCLLLLASCLLAAALPAGAEEPFAPLPLAATSFGAVVEDGALFVYGGHTGERHVYSADKVSGALHRLAPKPGAAWETLAPGEPVQGTALVAHGGRLYRVGGMAARNAAGEKGDLHSSATVTRFDTAAGRWTDLPPLPAARSSHDAVVLGDRLYVGGGWRLGGDPNQGDWATTVAVLDLSAATPAWEELPQPFQRRGLTLAALDDRLFFIGGMNSSNEPVTLVDILDTRSGAWSKGPDLPRGKLKGFGNSAAVAGGRVFVSGLSGDVFALRADGSDWETVAELKKPRFFHRLVALDAGTLLALGGEDDEGKIREIEVIKVGVGARAADSGWPQWRGPARDGVAPAAGWNKRWPDEGLPRLWQAKAGTGVSSPVIAGGRVYVTGNDRAGRDLVLALDARTGAEAWRHAFPAASTNHPMPIVPNGPAATPTVANGRVHVLSREGEYRVLDAATGELKWRTSLLTDLGGKRPVYGYAQSPLVADGRVYLDVGGAGGSTTALDAATGTVIWRAGDGEAGYSAARRFEHDGAGLVAMFKGEGLSVFEAGTGRERWRWPATARDFVNAATPVFIGNDIFISNSGTNAAVLMGFADGQARAAWRSADLSLLFNNAVLRDGRLFAFNELRRGVNEFNALDAATGRKLWTSDSVPLGTFILSDGHWVFLTRTCEVVLAPAAADGLRPAARFQALGGRTYATPALAEGALVVKNNDGEMAAFDLRPAG
ncbi:MAG: PQQ-binding-like beta-propeller repeat protein [Limisphaerales bacterium]